MFYIVPKKQESKVDLRIVSLADGVATFLLGRILSDYIIVKSDVDGDRVVTCCGRNYNDIVSDCRVA